MGMIWSTHFKGSERGIDRESGTEDSTLYSPLNQTRKEVRLLKVIATKPKIVCEMETVSLMENPVYFALSYVWGDATKTERVIVNRELALVSVSLARAIRCVHHYWGTEEVPEMHQWLWADALCINQRDAQEKNHQIPLMRMIYENAALVTVCLGTSDARKNLEKCFKAANTISHAAREWEQLFDQSAKYKYVSDWTGKVNGKVLARDFKLLSEDIYWRRVWTYQEIAIGQNVQLIAGSISISLKSLTLAESFMEMCDARTRHTMRGSMIVTHWSREIHQLMGIIDQINKAREGFREIEERTLDQSKRNQLVVRHLLRCCHQAISRKATDPKDYVYGYAGLFDFAINPDYSSEKTTASVYCDLAEQILILSENTNLTFLDYAGLGYAWELPCGLPSWAPNLSGVSDIHFSTHIKPRLALEHPQPTFLHSTKSLRCTAAILGSFADIGPQLSEGVGGNSTDWLMDWLFPIILHAYANGLPTSAKGMAVVDAITYISLYTFDPRLASLDPEFSHSVSQDDYHRLVYSLMLRWEQSFPGKEAEKLGFFKSLIPKPRGRQRYDMFEKNWNAGVLTRWYKDLMQRSQYKALRFAQTTEGHIGLFPPEITKEDNVAILDGLSNPVVLRKTGDCYAFVQVCYVTAYYKDLWPSLVAKDKFKWESIELR